MVQPGFCYQVIGIQQVARAGSAQDTGRLRGFNPCAGIGWGQTALQGVDASEVNDGHDAIVL